MALAKLQTLQGFRVRVPIELAEVTIGRLLNLGSLSIRIFEMDTVKSAAPDQRTGSCIVVSIPDNKFDICPNDECLFEIIPEGIVLESLA